MARPERSDERAGPQMDPAAPFVSQCVPPGRSSVQIACFLAGLQTSAAYSAVLPGARVEQGRACAPPPSCISAPLPASTGSGPVSRKPLRPSQLLLKSGVGAIEAPSPAGPTARYRQRHEHPVRKEVRQERVVCRDCRRNIGLVGPRPRRRAQWKLDMLIATITNNIAS